MTNITEFKHWYIDRPLERLQIKTARALPHWLVKWATIRAILHATQGTWGNQIVPDVTALEVLERWGEGPGAR